MAEIARQEFFSMVCGGNNSYSSLSNQVQRFGRISAITHTPQAVVGPFSPHSLMATSSNATTTTADSSFHMDFRTITQQEMLSFTVPIRWSIAVTGLIHGVASWFDCHFPNAEAMAATQSTSADPQSILLTTHPAAPITHWQQVRFVLDEPLAANAGDMVVGGMRCTANAMRSYDLAVDIWIEDGSGEARPNSKRHGTWNLHDQIYNYNYAHGGAVAPAGSSNDASMGVAATNAMAVDGAEREWLGLYAPVGRSSHRDQHVDQ